MNGFLQTHADRLASGCSGVSGGTKQKKIVRKGGGTDLLAGPREKYGGGGGGDGDPAKEGGQDVPKRLEMGLERTEMDKKVRS